MRALLFTAAALTAALLLACGGATDATQARKAEPADPAPKDDPALAGREVVQAGHVLVNCKGLGVGPVDLLSFGRPAESNDKYFKVGVGLSTKVETRKVEYRTWNEPEFLGPVPRLKDNLGNEYQPARFPAGAEVVGAVKGTARLDPGRPTVDLLVFEPPVRKAEYLILELPGSHVGAKGTVRFRIPAEQFAAK